MWMSSVELEEPRDDKNVEDVEHLSSTERVAAVVRPEVASHEAANFVLEHIFGGTEAGHGALDLVEETSGRLDGAVGLVLAVQTIAEAVAGLNAQVATPKAARVTLGPP